MRENDAELSRRRLVIEVQCIGSNLGFSLQIVRAKADLRLCRLLAGFARLSSQL